MTDEMLPTAESITARMQALKRKENKQTAKVDVNRSVYERAKAYAQKHKLTTVQVFEEIMRDGLERLEAGQ